MTVEASRLRLTLSIAAAVAAIFGLASIASGGMALFGGPAARDAVGNAVGFVLWFNFLAGFAYVAAGAGLVLRRPWASQLALAIAAATLLVFGAFGVHVLLGRPFEQRTVGAMALRSAVWIVIAWIACRARWDRVGE